MPHRKRHQLGFDIARSIRYHASRQAFFEYWHIVTSFLTILLAGSVLFDMAKPGENPLWLQVLAVCGALLAALDMAVGFSKRAALHSRLKDKFCALEIELLSSVDDADNLEPKRREIEREEPPIFIIVDLLCHNAQLIADGYKIDDVEAKFADIGLGYHLTAHFCRWPHYEPKIRQKPSAGNVSRVAD